MKGKFIVTILATVDFTISMNNEIQTFTKDTKGEPVT